MSRILYQPIGTKRTWVGEEGSFPNVHTFRDPWGFYAAWKIWALVGHLHFGPRFKARLTFHWRPKKKEREFYPA